VDKLELESAHPARTGSDRARKTATYKLEGQTNKIIPLVIKVKDINHCLYCDKNCIFLKMPNAYEAKCKLFDNETLWVDDDGEIECCFDCRGYHISQN
jgi:hypothetical protein